MKNNDDILRELSPPKKEKYRWDLYGVNAYCPSVQVTNWWYYREGFPKDYDAFHPPGNTNRSSYNRLGTYKEDENHWVSETSDAMRNGPGEASLQEMIKQSQPRPMLTFLSYSRTHTVACSGEDGTISPQDISPGKPLDNNRDPFPENPIDKSSIQQQLTPPSGFKKNRKDMLAEEIRTILPSLPKDLMKMRYSTTYNSYFKPVHIIRKK